VTRGTRFELERDDVGLRVLILITVIAEDIRVAGGIVRDPEERDTDKYRACVVGFGLNGKRVCSIIAFDLVHRLIVVHCVSSNSALHILEEIVVQA
jgi:hypothetical protein